MILRRTLVQCLAAALASPVLADEDFQSMWDRRIGHAHGPAELPLLPPEKVSDRVIDAEEPRKRRAHRDPVCGKRGRRYFHIGRRVSWRCRRAG